jgi:gamma-glutamyltranspeptidase
MPKGLFSYIYGNLNSVHFFLFSSMGSKVVGSRTGIIYNDMMGDFIFPDKNTQYPTLYPAPGKRPMAHSNPLIMVDDNGNVKFVGGSSGAVRITSTIAQVSKLSKVGRSPSLDPFIG